MPDVTQGAWSAFLVGLIVSPHCVGMCGPLYCAFLPVHNQRKGIRQESFQLAYHLGRVLAYTLVGGLAGAFSLQFMRLFDWDFSVYLPWVLVAMLVLVSTGLDRRLFPKNPLSRFRSSGLVGSVRRLPGELPSLGLGVVSPLLPCAPLYSVIWVALVSADPAFGAQLLLGFSLGTIPLLWLSQSQYLRNRDKWSSVWVARVQRTLAAVAALVITARILWVGGPLTGGFCIAPG